MTKRFFTLLVAILCLSGCARIMDAPKVIWGSSTLALEEARAEAISKTYRCSFNDCYDAVLGLAKEEKDVEPEVEEAEELVGAEESSSGIFDIFIDDRKKKHIVVMGVAGYVETTEIGIFFSQPTLTTVKIEVSSLSVSAKRAVADKMFEELDQQFTVAE